MVSYHPCDKKTLLKKKSSVKHSWSYLNALVRVLKTLVLKIILSTVALTVYKPMVLHKRDGIPMIWGQQVN